jgi:hypothetical protein
MNADTCIAIPADDNRHAEMDAYGKANGLTVTYAAWHPNPQYRMFKTGSLLSKNDKYPSGLVIVDEKGNPHPWNEKP